MSKLSDLLTFTRMCAPKYNTAELSDRILVFDVMPDGWDTENILRNVPANEASDEASETASSSASLETTSAKRPLETPEEPEQKRMKTEQGEENSSILVAQRESGKGEIGENESEQFKTREQAEEKQGGDPYPEDESEKLYEPSGPLRQHKIYTHSLWLSVQSPYFKSLLHSSGMKETQDTEIHLKIPESEENAHLMLLEAIYDGDILTSKTVTELLAVLELADKYDVKFVFMICKYILQKRATTFDISTEIMHMIKVKHSMNDVEDLVATLQSVLVEEFSPLDENYLSKRFTDLLEPSVRYLLRSDDLIVQSENTVFHALMYWMIKNEIDPGSLDETNDLLAVVRFELVTNDYLYNTIKNHPTATKMPKFSELYLGGMTYHAISSEQKRLLEKQPVSRKKPERNIIQCTFVLKSEDFSVANTNGAFVSPKTFWACGYLMGIGIFHNRKPSGVIYPMLAIKNLNKESLVPLKFSFFKGNDSSVCWHEESFSLRSKTKQYPHMSISPSSFKNNKIVLYVAVSPL